MAHIYQRYILCLSIGLFIGLIWATSQSQASGKTQLDDMTRFILNAELTEFLEAITGEQWFAPLMFSRWHVENIASKDVRADMLAARAFGKALLDRFTDWKTAMTSSTAPDELEQQIDLWLELADWLMKENGYGNVFLAVRCHDIATIGMGKLLVNLDYPFEQINQRIQRLDAPWYAPSSRRAILNQEVGAELFIVHETDEQAVQRELEKTWQRGMFAADRERRKTAGKTRTLDRDWMVIEALISVTLLHGPKIPTESLPFFEEDHLSYPPIITTATMWENKWHEKCVVGFEFDNASSLKALALFRKKVGYFPTTYDISEEDRQKRAILYQEYQKRGITLVPFEQGFHSPAEAAFNRAWQPFVTEETRYLDAVAWNAYDEIMTGRFLDQDTLTELQAKQLGQ